jgi:hypothetical protein
MRKRIGQVIFVLLVISLLTLPFLTAPPEKPMEVPEGSVEVIVDEVGINAPEDVDSLKEAKEGWD